MPLASLRVGSPAWRAGRAAAALGSLARAEIAPDDVLGELTGLGEPPGGWLSLLAHARSASTLALLLPRPGDPRGLALPRDLATDAAVGWGNERESTWLLAMGGGAWDLREFPGHPLMPPDAQEAHRRLREAIVQAAHALDDMRGRDMDGESIADDAGIRREHDALVDSWVCGPPALPPSARALADLGLRMLLAIDAGRDLTDVTALESAARSAVEAAFATSPHAR
jgi:hypothetical protein